MKKLVKNRFMSLMVCLAMVMTMMAAPAQALAAEQDVQSKVDAAEQNVPSMVEATEQDVQSKVKAVEAAALEEMENALNDTAQPLDIQPRAHTSYYPTRGANSGVFSGNRSNTVAIYNYLPSGTMKFSYSMSGGGTCYLLFHIGEGTSASPYRSAALRADDYTGTSSIYLPHASAYTVEVYYPDGNANTQIIYAFNLYRD